MMLLRWLAVLLCWFLGTAQAEEPLPEMPPAELTAAWQFRYGDSPRLPHARFAWSLPSSEQIGDSLA